MRGSALYDLMRGVIFCGCCYILQYVDVSMVYHYIRGQSVIKLYVIYNVLEVRNTNSFGEAPLLILRHQQMQVFDKLCCAFGQDIFDALFTRMTVPKPSDSTITTITHFIAAFVYVSIQHSPLSPPLGLLFDFFFSFTPSSPFKVVHSLVLFHQVITLNVAMNSHSNSLITLLVSNQFVELKGCVFKKFAKENLFQICCSGSFTCS